MKVRLATVVAAASLLAAALFVFDGAGPPDPPASPPKRNAEPRFVRDPLGSALIEVDATREDAPRTPEQVRAPARPPREMVTIDGLVVVADESGALHPETSGELFLGVTDPLEPMGVHRIEVHGGAFRVEVPRDATLLARSAVLDGRATAFAQDFVVVPISAPLRLEGRWLPRTFVHVVDRATGRELNQAVLCPANPNALYTARPTTDARPLSPPADSPLEVPFDLSSDLFWAHADGFTWEPLAIDPAKGGDRRIALDLAATIEATPAPETLRPYSFLYATRSDGLELEPVALGSEDLSGTFVDVPPGRYSVYLVRNDPARCVARAELTVATGEQARVSLPPPALGVSVAGTLEIPPDWSEEPRLTATSVDRPLDLVLEASELALIDEHAGLHRFRFEDVPPGRITLIVAPIDRTFAIDVPPAGIDSLQLRVEPPAEVIVRVRHRGTPIDARSVILSPRSSELVSHAVRSIDGAGPSFRARVPAGEVGILVDAAGLGAPWKVVAATAGPPTRVDVDVEPLVALDLSFAADGEAFSERVAFTAASIAGDGALVSSDANRHFFTKPGRYRLTFPRVPRFAPIDPIEVDVGSQQELVVELRR